MLPVTLLSLVNAEALARAGGAAGFQYCAEPGCDVVYFRPLGDVRIPRSELRVRVGQKESTAPRLVCYCFQHTIEDLEAEVAARGTSRIATSIAELCRRGLQRCEEANPQGFCCLGNVRRAIGEAQARLGIAPATSGPSGDGPSCADDPSCGPR